MADDKAVALREVGNLSPTRELQGYLNEVKDIQQAFQKHGVENGDDVSSSMAAFIRETMPLLARRDDDDPPSNVRGVFESLRRLRTHFDQLLQELKREAAKVGEVDKETTRLELIVLALHTLVMKRLDELYLMCDMQLSGTTVNVQDLSELLQNCVNGIQGCQLDAEVVRTQVDTLSESVAKLDATLEKRSTFLHHLRKFFAGLGAGFFAGTAAIGGVVAAPVLGGAGALILGGLIVPPILGVLIGGVAIGALVGGIILAITVAVAKRHTARMQQILVAIKDSVLDQQQHVGLLETHLLNLYAKTAELKGSTAFDSHWRSFMKQLDETRTIPAPRKIRRVVFLGPNNAPEPVNLRGAVNLQSLLNFAATAFDKEPAALQLRAKMGSQMVPITDSTANQLREDDIIIVQFLR
jgi:hypothetical protein